MVLFKYVLNFGGDEVLLYDQRFSPKACNVIVFFLHLSLAEAFKFAQFYVLGWNKNNIGFDSVFYSIYKCKPLSFQNKPLAFRDHNITKYHMEMEEGKESCMLTMPNYPQFFNQRVTEAETPVIERLQLGYVIDNRRWCK